MPLSQKIGSDIQDLVEGTERVKTGEIPSCVGFSREQESSNIF